MGFSVGFHKVVTERISSEASDGDIAERILKQNETLSVPGGKDVSGRSDFSNQTQGQMLLNFERIHTGRSGPGQ